MGMSRGRKTLLAALTLLAFGAASRTLAQASPVPAAPPDPVAPTALAATASAAPVLATPASTAAGVAADTPGAPRPLAALPYTPSLEPAFMDRSVDPCVDFYAYSCNGWRAQNPIPSDKSRWSVDGTPDTDNQHFRLGLL